MWTNTRPKRQYKTSKRRPELTAGSVGSCFKLEKISCSNLRPAKLGETLNEEKEMKNKIKKCRVILVYGRQSSEDAHGGRDLLFCVHPASSAVKKEKFEYFCTWKYRCYLVASIDDCCWSKAAILRSAKLLIWRLRKSPGHQMQRYFQEAPVSKIYSVCD